MATQKKQTVAATTNKKSVKSADDEDDASTAVAVVKKGANALATADQLGADFLEQFAGSGMEGADADSFAIPFLAVLQKMSPAVDADDPAYIEGAKAGMFIETVSRNLLDGKEGVRIVPCAYQRQFIRWGAEDGGEGFKGSYTPEQIVTMRENGQISELDGRLYFPLPDGSVSEKKCDRVSDTRNHYVLLLDDEGGWTRALLSLSSTQIKKSKHLMSALSNVKLRGRNGMYTPPTFANVVRATTKLEQNDKGSWHGIVFTLEGREGLTQDIFNDAKAFCEEVRKGGVAVNHDQAARAEGTRGNADENGDENF